MKELMHAAQLVSYKKPLEVRKVPVPVPRGENVLVRVAGSGLCHSDLYLMDGRSAGIPPYMPFTLGHENAGYVEALGENVKGLKKGDPVAVYGGWNDVADRFTWSGNEQLGNLSKWVGLGQPGGYAEYLLVPTYRYLIPLGELNPVEAAPLTDAGLTPYRAIKKVLPHTYPGSTLVIIGVGGLGQFGVQYASLLSQSTIVAVDIDDAKLEIARKLGAQVVINSRKEDVVAKIRELTGGEGAQGILDIVGSDETLQQAYGAAGRQAKIVVVGLGGGTLHFATFARWGEIEVTTSNWGNMVELHEVIRLAQTGRIRPAIQRVRLEEMNKTFKELAKGKITGRAVLVPES